jgi:Na+-transporting methylmalonyl-CoA/oxaloacetate decarboxylase gamma subunit
MRKIIIVYIAVAIALVAVGLGYAPPIVGDILVFVILAIVLYMVYGVSKKVSRIKSAEKVAGKKEENGDTINKDATI